jgi:predicted nucleic acid-binding protein
MPKKFLLDTNILVYAFDLSDVEKDRISTKLINQALAEGVGCCSYQVVQEFCNVMLKDKGRRMNTEDLVAILEAIILPLQQEVGRENIYSDAVKLTRDHKLQFYDALIIQSAIYLKCDILYSEDLQDGRKFGKLIIKNPFK